MSYEIPVIWTSNPKMRPDESALDLPSILQITCL